ncbi:1,4-alpha-glucan branching protein GlgB [Bordetella muralis]|uniref:1,4-alpha-glucan branching protein GlgB n=1 Tax=Bordetella muralis TaxID=1649130 RepID=UPI0039EE95C6
MSNDRLSDTDRRALLEGSHSDPFSVLGPHGDILRVLMPGAVSVQAQLADGETIDLSGQDGLFHARVPGLRSRGPLGYRLRVRWPDSEEELFDPYAFDSCLSDATLAAFSQSDWRAVFDMLPRLDECQGVRGLRCSVWAPNARRVSLAGDFNGWDARRHGMRLRHQAGVWEFFLPHAQAGQRYKFAVLDHQGQLRWKADPLAQQTECPPDTASVITDPQPYEWQDDAWMNARDASPEQPVAIYEVHAGSWGNEKDWDSLSERLPAYVSAMGFTHVELMPVAEYPFGGSWGYQPLGQFAPTARYGSPTALARFIDRCHAVGLGVIMDWVPAHFPDDPHGLARFDGTALYEYADPREGYHPDWHSCVYNLGRNEVRAMLLASAHQWLDRFHIDGLRVDAVASMLYRDYSRAPGEWLPNRYGGRENLEAIDFLRILNDSVHGREDGSITVAEESTAWPGVTGSTAGGGLGFDYKWNMGWMNDTLRYMKEDPLHRRYHHRDMTFGLVYAYSEHFILPLSHDEVVHGKGSLLTRMPGDHESRIANLRAYFGYMWMHPGKKLLFMGGELAQPHEWHHDHVLDWNLLDQPTHRGVQRLVRALNQFYRNEPVLFQADSDPAGFAWTIGDDADNSVLAFERRSGDAPPLLVICNLTPVARHGYRVGVSRAGNWRERLNTSDAAYGGHLESDGRSWGSEDIPAHGHSHSLSLSLPGLTTLVLKPVD